MRNDQTLMDALEVITVHDHRTVTTRFGPVHDVNLYDHMAADTIIARLSEAPVLVTTSDVIGAALRPGGYQYGQVQVSATPDGVMRNTVPITGHTWTYILHPATAFEMNPLPGGTSWWGSREDYYIARWAD